MIYVRLQDKLVELPTASAVSVVDGHLSATDEAGNVVARFEKLDVLAYSSDRNKVDAGLDPRGQSLVLSDLHRDGGTST